MESKSELGVIDQYDVTLVIAGEEDFWGDPAFWLESWIDYPGRPRSLLWSRTVRDRRATSGRALPTRTATSAAPARALDEGERWLGCSHLD